MKEIIQKLNLLTFQTYLDEDGNALKLILKPAISIDELNDFEQSKNFHIPSYLREILLFSNGINLFGTEIVPLVSMEYFAESKMLSFHKWGNGDFDVLNQKGNVFFAYHSIECLVSLELSLTSWIREVINEIKFKKTLLHPLDYRINSKENGVYKKIHLKLSTNNGNFAEG